MATSKLTTKQQVESIWDLGGLIPLRLIKNVWKQIDEALGFAYRTPPHRQIVSGVREHNRLIDSMFIRMSPYRASGTWPSTSRFAPAFQRFADSMPSHVPV